jgi:hypothetical protein
MSCGPYQSHKTRVIKQSPPAEPTRVEGIHTYDGVLPGAPKGPFATLLSPPPCHAAFGTMPHTLVWWTVLGRYPLRDEDEVGFWRGNLQLTNFMNKTVLETLIFAQLVKNFPGFNGTELLIIVFTRDRYKILY